MIDQDGAMRNKKIRGWIVRILQRAYPAGFEADTLHKQLTDLGYAVTKNELIANLTYLKEDGFIENPQFGIGSFYDGLNNEFYKLTTKGVDLAEGTISDKGVDL